LQEELQKRKYSKFDNMWSNDTYVYWYNS
jgi:hypothetical protein